ncbi:thiamine diphosphokinase [Oceanibium sediminis]|uniref:thiamine diphosphokinase n=1 Tax=Oceanibium sediminis TaxID=2026339 RepID=UPI000DD33A25|nr:thiamine diphosphokinase [Oceanibium sediminis]
MPNIRYSTTDPLTLAGGAPFSAGTLRRALALAPEIVAADGGADLLRAAGAMPRAIFGDLDSLDMVETWQNSDVAMFKIVEQETTDFEKCLYSLSAPLILGIGFLGGRIDHAYAAMAALVRYPAQKVVLLGEHDLVIPVPRALSLELEAGTTVSLMPMAAIRATESVGLEWPVTGMHFAPDGKIGTSNRATGGAMRLGFDGPGMLVSLPLSTLEQVVAALSTQAR